MSFRSIFSRLLITVFVFTTFFHILYIHPMQCHRIIIFDTSLIRFTLFSINRNFPIFSVRFVILKFHSWTRKKRIPEFKCLKCDHSLSVVVFLVKFVWLFFFSIRSYSLKVANQCCKRGKRWKIDIFYWRVTIASKKKKKNIKRSERKLNDYLLNVKLWVQILLIESIMFLLKHFVSRRKVVLCAVFVALWIGKKIFFFF